MPASKASPLGAGRLTSCSPRPLLVPRRLLPGPPQRLCGRVRLERPELLRQRPCPLVVAGQDGIRERCSKARYGHPCQFARRLCCDASRRRVAVATGVLFHLPKGRHGAFGLICATTSIEFSIATDSSEPPAAPAGVTRFVRVSRIVFVCARSFEEFSDAHAIM